MSDIRKRTGKKGTTYQVRYPSEATKTGYAYKTFDTMKEARAWLESGGVHHNQHKHGENQLEVTDAIDKWLHICEAEGTDGNDPVTEYTLKTYHYFAKYMKAYPWDKQASELTPPDIVLFRSWLLANCPSRCVARKALTHFQTVMNEMALRGLITANVATGINISTNSRYERPVTPPSEKDFLALLAAADRLANSKHARIAKAWERYRPMLYLAGDTGMRPGEYLALPSFNITHDEVKVDRAVERSGRKISVTKTPAGCRWIDLSPATADMVLHYAKHHAAPNDYDLVFPNSQGRWQSSMDWGNQGFAMACIEAGLVEQVERNGDVVDRPKYTPYDLRHFYASMLIEQRVNLKKIQRLMGHRNITTTLNVYGHLIDKVEASSDDKTGMISRLAPNRCGEIVARTS